MTSVPKATASAVQHLDWEALRAEAVAASRRAYVPYSKFPVGVAAVTTTGRVLTGCNVENAAYGVVLCAECGLVSALLDSPGRSDDRPSGPVMDVNEPRELLVALSCVDGTGTPIMPCGRCRQLLAEHAAPATDAYPGLLVDRAGHAPIPLTDLFPHGFGVADLRAVPISAETLKGDS